MSCNNDNYNNICRQDIPYPQVSPESVPSLISNLVNALYGEITKSVVDGRVVWNVPCDPNNSAEIDGFPRLPDEGLLCYIIRYFDVLAPSLINAVTINGTQTITGQKTFTLPVLGDAVNNTLDQTIAGQKTFTLPVLGDAVNNTLDQTITGQKTFTLPVLGDAVNSSLTQTIAGQKTFTLPVLGDAVNNTLAQTITGNKTFNWIKLPVGTTGTRPTGETGLVRFNTDRNQFEGYNNTTWTGIGDQPVGGGANRLFFENDQVMTDNYTITSGKNAMSAGPITVNPGVILTVPSGSVYTIV
jgi:hypothetical protein